MWRKRGEVVASGEVETECPKVEGGVDVASRIWHVLAKVGEKERRRKESGERGKRTPKRTKIGEDGEAREQVPRRPRRISVRSGEETRT